VLKKRTLFSSRNRETLKKPRRTPMMIYDAQALPFFRVMIMLWSF
jgi:hypothetical protein